MERLTRIIEDGPISVLSVCQTRVEDVSIWKEWSVSKDSSIKEALLRLAAYEDTGLTPEVCAEYKKFEDEVIASGMTFGELVELMHEKQDGRLVTLPTVKIGDVVEWDSGVCKELFQIRGIVTYTDGTRYDLGEFMPFADDEHICRIIPRDEAEAELRKAQDER